jgi:hypothetical protein
MSGYSRVILLLINTVSVISPLPGIALGMFAYFAKQLKANNLCRLRGEAQALGGLRKGRGRELRVRGYS